MGLTDKQIQKRWDANVKAVQDAKARCAAAREDYTGACKAVTAVVHRPGFRRRQLLNELTPEDVDALIEVEDFRDSAAQAVRLADEALRAAQATFKAGVVEEED
jgi:hypothetical protein